MASDKEELPPESEALGGPKCFGQNKRAPTCGARNFMLDFF